MSCKECIRYDYVQFEENGPEWRYCHHRGIRPLTEEQAGTGCVDRLTVEEHVKRISIDDLDKLLDQVAAMGGNIDTVCPTRPIVQSEEHPVLIRKVERSNRSGPID